MTTSNGSRPASSLAGLARSAALLAALIAAGCAPRPLELSDRNPFPPQPPDLVEIMPRPPVAEEAQIWQPGHWDWTGASYAWTPGHWTARGNHGPNWRMGVWARPNGVWTWIPGGWM